MTDIIRNNRKKIIIILVILELISLFLLFKSLSSKNALEDNIKGENTIYRKQFSMYIENDNGTYDEYISSNLFPTGYFINLDKSNCVDMNDQVVDNVLSSNGNMVTVTSNKTVFCYLYFDLPKPSVTLTVSTDGVSNTLPTYNKYIQTLTCDDGTTSTFSIKYQRLEISNVSNTNTKCNLNYSKDTATYTLLKDKVESVNTTNNNGYRYSGKQPDNWVWFNNELWRIIGSIPTTLSDKTVENRVKIIRAESIGGLAYHSSSSNTTWGSNTLYTLLNSYYYGKKDATGSSPCLGYSSSVYALCNYTKKGISSSETDYYGRMVIDVYMNAGTVSSTSTAISDSYTTEAGTLTSNTAKIGLMTASDYGYATSEITYSSVNLSSLSSYATSNWLYGQSIERTMTASSTSRVMCVGYSGYVVSYYATDGLAVRPVLYLDSSVYIISGEGTESNPYILGM